jgi:predicted transcriptional regulator
MMLKYRTRSEIVCQILTSAKDMNGVTKTRIMFQAFLSFAQLKDYLSILLENDLLIRDTKTNTYKTTDKGIKMLEAYQKLNDLVGAVNG